MKERVLKLITPKENKTYIDSLNTILSDSSLYLTNSELEALCFEKPIIGQVLENHFECERVLRLRKLESIEYQPREYKNGNIWLITRGINENCSLSIGCNNNEVEFFQEICRKEDSYLFEVYGKPVTRWLRPSKDFLQVTLGLLKPEDQPQFRELNPILIKK